MQYEAVDKVEVTTEIGGYKKNDSSTQWRVTSICLGKERAGFAVVLSVLRAAPGDVRH